MKLEILLSCMHQTDDSLVRKSNITSDALLLNQCAEDAVREYPNGDRLTRLMCTTKRGLTRSRNMAIDNAGGDVCLLCDDDEQFFPGYEERILDAYRQLPQADVVIVKIIGQSDALPDKVTRLRFPSILRVASWQISFRRDSLIRTGVRFDELLGAGSGNGAEEEMKFLLDCQRAGLKIYYAPVEVAAVNHTQSTWFEGFTESFFYQRGGTTRYILGPFVASCYALYYVLRKRSLYLKYVTTGRALRAIFRGIRENPVGKQAKSHGKGV